MTASIFPGSTLFESTFSAGTGFDGTSSDGSSSVGSSVDSSACERALAAASRSTAMYSTALYSAGRRSTGRRSPVSPGPSPAPAVMLLAGAGAASGLPGSSRLIAAAGARIPSRRRASIGRFSGAEARVGVPLALAAVLLGVALLVAPEQPRDQEAICQRHNGVAACRVW